MRDVVLGLGLILAIEGIAYALFPNTMRRMVARVLSESPDHVRQIGLLAAIVGLGIILLVRS